MEFQQIQEFLSSPQLPDIISYILVIIAFIMQHFVKSFVKKDNFLTNAKIETKVTKLNNLQSILEKSDTNHEKEREEWKKEKEEILQELNNIKKTLKIFSLHTSDLVKNGISNKIAKMFPIEIEEDFIIEEDIIKTKESE